MVCYCQQTTKGVTQMASINIEALEGYMKNKNITQRKLAQKLNIDPSYFWRIMRGEKDGGGKVISGIVNLCLQEGLEITDYIFFDEPLSADNETSATKDSA